MVVKASTSTAATVAWPLPQRCRHAAAVSTSTSALAVVAATASAEGGLRRPPTTLVDGSGPPHERAAPSDKAPEASERLARRDGRGRVEVGSAALPRTPTLAPRHACPRPRPDDTRLSQQQASQPVKEVGGQLWRPGPARLLCRGRRGCGLLCRNRGEWGNPGLLNKTGSGRRRVCFFFFFASLPPPSNVFSSFFTFSYLAGRSWSGDHPRAGGWQGRCIRTG